MFNRTTSIHFRCCRCRCCLSIFIFTLMRHWIPLLANMGGVYRTRNWIVCIHHACVCVCWCLWHNVCDAFYQLVWSVVYLYSIEHSMRAQIFMWCVFAGNCLFNREIKQKRMEKRHQNKRWQANLPWAYIHTLARPLTRPLAHTFRFPFCQCIWYFLMFTYIM